MRSQDHEFQDSAQGLISSSWRHTHEKWNSRSTESIKKNKPLKNP